MAALDTLLFARKSLKSQRPKNINDSTKLLRSGQHSIASAFSMQIDIILVIVSQKFGAMPPYNCCRRVIMMSLQVCEQIFVLTYRSVQ